MQGQRSSTGTLPDTISFDHIPIATDANIDQQVFWNNNFQAYNQNMAPEYITSSANNGSIYINSASQAQNLSGWNMGESSSSGTQNYDIHNEQKTEDASNNAISVSGVDLNQTSSHIPYSPLFMQCAGSSTFPQNLNMGVEVGENSGNNCQVIEESMRPPPSTSSGYFGEEIYSSEGSRLSCKRKAIEGHIGQSSTSGSSSYFQPREGNGRTNIPGWYDSHFGSGTSSTSLENTIHAGPQDQLNARLGLSSNRNPSEIPLPLNSAPTMESSRRSHRVRINSSPQLNPPPAILPNGSISGDSNALAYPQSSRLVPLNNFPGTRTPQSSRWSRGSSSRAGYSLSFGERIARRNEELESIGLQRAIPENPIFVPTNEASRDSPQIPPGWGLPRGNLSINENLSRSSHPVSSPSGLPHRTPPRYSRRLSEYVRRSLLSSPLLESGGQSSNSPLQPGSSSQQVAPSSGAGDHGDRLSRLRSALLLERQLDSAFGGTSSLRTAAAGPEGRSRLVSEIRNVLDLMRRSEGLRLEDVVILDQSVFFGMADIHDRHRDMRLDVDNMSYEELLALEERMGNVSTGLSEETILNHLKQRKFFSIAMGAQTEVEPCCICREEYDDGEDIGTVECGHEFHSGCIKQWLMLKNSCPICKTTALNK